MFSAEQKKYVRDKMAKWIWYFGYAKVEGNDKTGFFEFENPTEEQKASFKGYKKNNENAIKQAVEKKCTNTYLVNSTTETRTIESFPLDKHQSL